MQNKKEKINICFTVFVVVLIALAAFFSVNHAGDAPGNPMEKRVSNASRMYDNGDYGIGISEDLTYDDQKDSDDSETSDNSEGASDSEKQGNYSEGNGSNTEGTDVNSEKNSKNIGKAKKISTEKTDIVYFTTSIIDGETVPKYEYSFTITHLVEELQVESVVVYVNDYASANFNGSVILSQGKNTIKVSVTYRTEDEQEIRAEKSYTVNVDTNNLCITTNLKNQIIDSPFLDFIAYATMGEAQAEIIVKLNDKEIQGTDNNYSVTLAQGKNIITMNAAYGKYSIVKTYEITFQSNGEFHIYTTLKNQTVNTNRIEFKALIMDGTPKSELSVIVNGSIVSGENDVYKASLKIGNNTIRLKATDTNSVSINQTYIIKYVPVATKETEPKLTYINVTDGMEISGEKFTLNIGAEDYKGTRIYYDGISVTLNGKKIQYRWSSNYTSYLLNLQSGENQLEIRLTDRDGRYKDFSYKLNCTYIEEGTLIGSVTICIDAKVLNLGVLMKTKVVDIYYGDNGATVFERAMEDSGYTYEYSGTVSQGFYLETIARPGMLRGWKIDDALKEEIIEDGLQFNLVPETGEYVYDMNSLGQLDFCQGSGWMYSVNGEYKEYSMSEYVPEDGDVIEVRYTLAYGKDIGAYNSGNGMYGIKEQYSNTY